MARADKKKTLKKSDTNKVTLYIFKDIKRNFSSYVIKLGAHITRLAVYEASVLKRTAGRLAAGIYRHISPFTDYISNNLKRNTAKIKTAFGNADKYFFWHAEDTESAFVNNGLFSALGLASKRLAASCWGRRRYLVTAFNWVMPVVSVAFLAGVISGVVNLNYGIEVECNGRKLGVIAEEDAFDAAQKEMQERITYVEGNEKVVISPKFSVQLIDSTEDVVAPEQLADKMIENSESSLIEAYGFYINDTFFGAVSDKTSIERTLEGLLSTYSAPGVKSLRFKDDVQFKEGLYLSDSLVDSSAIISQVTSFTSADRYYTIVKGDSPILIANKCGIDYDTMKQLNPTIEQRCMIGDQVRLTVAQPYLSVEVIKEETYEEYVDYEIEKTDDSSLYKGISEIDVRGVQGVDSVTAEVVYENGIETSRTILSTTRVSDPVTERVRIGTKSPKPSAGTRISGNGIYSWPVAGGYISAYMGDGRGHKGIDIAAPRGTSIFAAESGRVIMSQWYSGYGYCIKIQHDDGNVTLYGHCSQLIAGVGQRVEKGEIIALVGSTGQSTGNHCHFEVIHNGVRHNPLDYVG